MLRALSSLCTCRRRPRRPELSALIALAPGGSASLCLPGMILPTLPPMLPALSHLANSLHTIGDYYVAGDVDAALNVAREEPLMLPLGAVIGGLALASRDGWGAERFHDRVDICGSALVVAASGGAVAGGYNPSGWASTDDYSSSTSAFVFAIERSGVWHRMGTTGGAAIYDNARSGPTFGSDALVVGAGMAPVMGGFAGPDTESMQQQVLGFLVTVPVVRLPWPPAARQLSWG